MDSQAGDPPSKKGRLIPLSEHPQMDRLADILENLPENRREAFSQWLEEEEGVDRDDTEEG
jgi:chromatin segregation and condensation protein Rec8/ScpA/Scc1 (kleisin family)